MDADPKIWGIVLAAGASSRMGTPKQLLPYRGKPIVEHSVMGAIRCGQWVGVHEEIVVVLGHVESDVRDALTSLEGVRLVVNPDYETGQASSLRSGLEALPDTARAALIFLGDEPDVPTTAIETVVHRYAETGGPVVRPRYRGRPGHPVLLDRSVWPSISSAAGASGSNRDRGAAPALAHHPDWIEWVDLDLTPPAEVDTPEDYRKLTGESPSS